MKSISSMVMKLQPKVCFHYVLVPELSKVFDSCLFWLSLFVYIQAATVSCAEAAMSLSSYTHTLDWWLMQQLLAGLAANTWHGFPSFVFETKVF